jgi:thiosulfate/3-mercaptopyruvate sulfurtransferase
MMALSAMNATGDLMIRPCVVALLMAFAIITPAAAQPGSAATIPQSALVQPEELAASLKAGQKPVILQVGFRKMYDEAHIPGAIYAGPTGKEDGIAQLKTAAGSLGKDKPVVIYCGCCPWEHCPNVAAAWKTLSELGFTKLKVLYIPSNFGADWAEKGYPVVHG